MSKKKDDIKEVRLPKTVQTRLQAYVAQVEVARGNLDRYLQGICDAMGLEGQWNLDVQKMMAIKVEAEPPKEGHE